MPSFSRFFRAAAIGLGLALGSIGTVAAQPQPQPNIAVPTPTPFPTPGYGFEGCYMIQQPIFGNYFVSFCLQQFGGGNYGVTGAINCSGRVTWNQYQAQANIQLQYTTCTNRQSWSPDLLTCYLQQPVYPYVGPGVDPRVAIPQPIPPNPGLQCNYKPSMPGYPQITVYPVRVYY